MNATTLLHLEHAEQRLDSWCRHLSQLMERRDDLPDDISDEDRAALEGLIASAERRVAVARRELFEGELA